MQGGLSALMMCCEEGNSEMAKLLLDSEANPNLQQSVEGHTHIHLPPCPFCVEISCLTCYVNPVQSTGYTALMFACKGGHLETVKVLREHGADSQIRNAVSDFQQNYSCTATLLYETNNTFAHCVTH